MARILVVDDVKYISLMLSQLFAAKGHEVHTAEDGRRALALAREHDFDAILLDVMMPGMDGLEVARALYEDFSTRHVPIMMVTAKRDEATIRAALEVGVQEYLVKPFDGPALLEKVTKMIGRHRMHFEIEVEECVPVVTALDPDSQGLHVEYMGQALQAAWGGGERPVVLDLKCVSSIGDDALPVVLDFETRARMAGSGLEIVRPKAGPGVAEFLEVARLNVRIHGKRAAAVAAARETIDRRRRGASERTG